jgi:hypothetical protein
MKQVVVDKKFKRYGKHIVDVDKKFKLTIINEKIVFVVQYFTFYVTFVDKKIKLIFKHNRS